MILTRACRSLSRAPCSSLHFNQLESLPCDLGGCTGLVWCVALALTPTRGPLPNPS
jgi:hypothetical protein